MRAVAGACAVLCVALAGCAAGSGGKPSGSPSPTVAASTVPRLSLSGFDRARLGLSCDEVRTARARISAGDPEADVAAALSQAAAGFARIADPVARQEAADLRAATTADRSRVVASVLAVCQANGS